MIDASLAAALARVADRANDVLHGYQAGFEPSADVARKTSPLLPDGRALATSAPPGTYFIVEAEGRALYTRDGDLRFVDGTLRTAGGATVLGRPLAGGSSTSLIPLRVDPVDATLRQAREPRIEPDGLVTFSQSTIDPRTGVRREERLALGRVALAAFPAGTQPVRIDANRVAAPAGVVPRVGVPGDRTFGALRIHVRELGRLDLEAGLRKLQEAYLALDALRAAHQAHGELEKGAMDLLK